MIQHRRSMSLLRRLSADRSGLAMLEFALAFPMILAIGSYGIKVTYLAFMSMKVSRLSLNLADAASRVGADVGAGVSQLREADVNDVFTGTRLAGKSIALGDISRITLPSPESVEQNYDAANASYKQRIHWQRCLGKLFIQPQIIHQTAPLIGRDDRDLRQIYPTPTSSPSTCNLFNT